MDFRYPPLDSMALRVAERAILGAKYKSKKRVKTQDGDTMTVYEYSDKQVANRNRDKAERIEKLRHSVDDLRTKTEKDLKAKDAKTRLTALAVALIDHTYERVGNDESADDGHFGVTGWQKKHVSLGSGGATIKYVGKSGVKHEKKVTDSAIVSGLRQAYKDAKADSSCLFEYDGGCVDAKSVNEYLKEFDVTAKDLRGFHANREMQERLTEIRKKGPKLPEDRKEREKLLKDEFKEALEGAAETVGHEASTLRSQYLVPALEESYVHDGTVIKKLNEKFAFADDCKPKPLLLFADRVIRQLVDHMLGENMVVTEQDFKILRQIFKKCSGSWERVWEGDLVHNELLKTVVTSWGLMPGRRQDMERT
jgi:hypothetical protein